MKNKNLKTALGVAAFALFSLGRRLLKFRPNAEVASTGNQIADSEQKPSIKEKIKPPVTPSTRQQRRRAAIEARRRERRPEARRKRKRKRFLKILLSSSLAALGALASGVSLYSYYTSRISVNPVGTLSPSDPFSTMFSVSNDGYFTLHSVQVGCHIIHLRDAKKNGLEGVSTQNAESYAGVVNAGDKITVKCWNPVGSDQPWVSGEFEIIVSYRASFYPWSQTRRVRFVGERSTDGTLHWFQQPIGNQ